jgi:hypothetical protein
MACSCGVQEGRLHRPGCDLTIFPIPDGPEMTDAQAHALNRIYRRDYKRHVLTLTHLEGNPEEVPTWETWADNVTGEQVFLDADARPAYRRYQGIELNTPTPVLAYTDIRVYPCADGCGASVCVSGPLAALRGPTSTGWFVSDHAPKGYSHHGPRYREKACA